MSEPTQKKDDDENAYERVEALATRFDAHLRVLVDHWISEAGDHDADPAPHEAVLRTLARHLAGMASSGGMMRGELLDEMIFAWDEVVPAEPAATEDEGAPPGETQH